MLRIVLDTNVFYSALQSQQGAAHRLLREIGRSEDFAIHVSVPLVLEYEEIAKRNSRQLGLRHQDIDDILDYLCAVAKHHDIFYLWRPLLPDPDDDMLLELAVVAECDRIVTYNVRDFGGVEHFGLQAVTPGQFLAEIGIKR